jgi:PAS domain S-box-containing protein
MKTKEADIHYTAYLNGLPQPVITTDTMGVILSCNQAAEKLFKFQSENFLQRNIGEFLLAHGSPAGIIQTIVNLKLNEKFSGQCLLKKADGEACDVRITISGVINTDNELASALISIDEYPGKSISLHQLETINQTLTNLSDNFLDNVNIITALCGELLGASSALYNRLHDGLLCSFGKWNTAPEHNPVVKPEGRICYDVIKKAENEVYCVRNLPETPYADSDPNVKLFDLKNYLGHMVRCNGEPVGSLCIVFQRDYEYTSTDRYILSRLALAIEAEETSESLRKSKNRYRELFDFAVEGILIGSPKGIITDSNKSIHLMTGFESKELVGHHISEVLFTVESRKEKPFRFDLLQQDQLIVNERNILCKDKRIITVEMHSKMMPDHTYQTVLFDVTARKETEKKLHLSENTYRGIINSLNDAIYILDKDGCFLDVNTAAEKLYGYKKEYFVHKNPGFLSAPGLNDMDQTARFIKEAYSGKPVRFEFWGLRKDGSVFPKEVSLAPGMWFDQKVVVAVGREMTERKLVEESLRVSEEKYRMLVQYSSDPIFSFNSDGTYRFVNDAFAVQFGKKPEEIIGKTPFDIFPSEEAEKRLRLVRQVLHTGEKGEIEVKVVNSQGEQKFYLTMADPIKDAQGKILWVACISKDITQRKKAEEELRLKNEQLKAINAEKDKFFSIVAHDLRGPMNGFLGLTGIMAEDIESLSAFELKEIATTMRTSAVNIYRLIENLLEWSKMQRGTISFEPQPMFLKSSLTKSIELMRDTANKKEIELRIDIPEHNTVFADIHMLETIVRNLLSNALKFSFKRGIIEISAVKTEDDMVRIAVKDHGIGMSPTLLSKLFTLTENVNRKGTEGEPSTGLGLILCKEFVEKQGGAIWVESKEGEGSSFIFTLPQS